MQRSAARKQKNTTKPEKNKRQFGLFQEHCYEQWIDGQWSSVLQGSEQVAVRMVAARTLRWGKATEIIPMRHMTEGITNRKTGESVYGGCNLSKRTLVTVLAKLVDEGFLIRIPFKKTYRYGLNLRDMATDDDPFLRRKKAKIAKASEIEAMRRADRANLVRAERAWREQGSTEAYEVFMELLGKAGPTIRGSRRHRRSNCAPGAETPIENAQENEIIGANPAPIKEEHNPILPSLRSERDREPLARRRGGKKDHVVGLPARRARPAPESTTPAADETIPTKRQRRVRRDVAVDATNRDLIQHVRATASATVTAQRAAPAPVPANAPASAPVDPVAAFGTTTVRDAIIKGMQNAADRQARKRAKDDVNPRHLEEVWTAALTRVASARAATAWTPKQRGRMRYTTNRIALPDPTMRWGQIVHWAAANWGEAVSLSIPFLLHAKDAEQDNDERWLAKREELLDAVPRLDTFLHFADAFVAAYTTLFHGEGFRQPVLDRAARDQAQHAAYLARHGAIAAHGYDALPAEHMHVDELQDLANRLAERGDEAIADLLAERGKWQSLARQLRRDRGSHWRRDLEGAIARAKREAAIAARTPEEQAEIDRLMAEHNHMGEWGDDE